MNEKHVSYVVEFSTSSSVRSEKDMRYGWFTHENVDGLTQEAGLARVEELRKRDESSDVPFEYRLVRVTREVVTPEKRKDD